MTLFHHENEVGPFHELWRQRLDGIGGQTGRRDLDSRIVGKYPLRRRAAKPIFAAQEQDVLQNEHSRPASGRSRQFGGNQRTKKRRKTLMTQPGFSPEPNFFRVFCVFRG